MKKEEILPKRKSTRLKGYNYNTPGAYFITICVKGKKEILSKIIKNDNNYDIPKNTLTQYGQIANKHLENMSNFYDNIKLEKYVIMPNHIHLLIKILDCDNGSSRTPNPTNSLIAQFVSTFKRFCNKEYRENIWQRLSNDHIIRSEKEYKNIWNYIDTNVSKWNIDCFYSDNIKESERRNARRSKT